MGQNVGNAAATRAWRIACRQRAGLQTTANDSLDDFAAIAGTTLVCDDASVQDKRLTIDQRFRLPLTNASSHRAAMCRVAHS